MKPSTFRLAFLAVLGVALAPDLHAQSSEIAAINDLQFRQADAWNKHDAAAYAALFTEDGDVVNVMGWRWRGRAEIERQLTQAFEVVFKDSRLTITHVDVKLLDPRLARAYVRWTMDGAKPPPGAPAPPREGIQLQVLQKAGNDWKIVSFQNTNSAPERPFPKGPPPPLPPKQ